jgi:hypothetical protein
MPLFPRRFAPVKADKTRWTKIEKDISVKLRVNPWQTFLSERETLDLLHLRR